MPVEWLIPMLPVALVTLAGVAVFIGSRRKKSRKIRRVGIGLIAAPWVFFLVLSIVRPGIDEWNPRIESDSQVWDDWEGDGHALDLKPTGDFALFAKGEVSKGRWKRDDWNLVLTAEDGRSRRMRFVEDAGELLILAEPPSQGSSSSETGPVMRKP